ncbi:MAG: MCP four helix bundle domain-containing protein, partial [Chloroflexota bacterium]
MKLNIMTKLLAGFAAVLVLTGIVGWIGINNLNTVSGLMDGMYVNQLLPVGDLGEAGSRLERVRANQLIYLLSEDEAGMAEAEQKVAEHEQALVALIDKYRQTE